MTTRDPTAAAVLSRVEEMPVSGETGGMLEALFREHPVTRRRRQGMDVLERLYLQPAMDMTAYRRDVTTVRTLVANGIAMLTLTAPEVPTVIVSPGPTARDSWTVTEHDERGGWLDTRNAASEASVPAALPKRPHAPRVVTGTGVVVPTEMYLGTVRALRDMRLWVSVAVGMLVAVFAMIPQLVFGVDLLVAVLASAATGNMATITLWIAAWLMGREATVQMEQQRTPPVHDELWTSLRTSYDAHGIRMEGLRQRASMALRAFPEVDGTDGSEVDALLIGTLRRLSQSYSAAIRKGIPGHELEVIEDRMTRTLETVVTALEREADASRADTTRHLDDIDAHVNKVIGASM